MSRSVEVRGETIEMEGDPQMRTVRYVQNMQIDVMRRYFSDETIAKIEQVGEDEMFEVMLEDADMDDFTNMLWDQNLLEPLQTIILASDKKFDTEDVDEMRSSEFMQLRNAAEEALGGSAQDFFEELGIGISSQLNRMAEENQNTDSQNLLPGNVSSESSEPSGGTKDTKSTTTTS